MAHLEPLPTQQELDNAVLIWEDRFSIGYRQVGNERERVWIKINFKVNSKTKTRYQQVLPRLEPSGSIQLVDMDLLPALRQRWDENARFNRLPSWNDSDRPKRSFAVDALIKSAIIENREHLTYQKNDEAQSVRHFQPCTEEAYNVLSEAMKQDAAPRKKGKPKAREEPNPEVDESAVDQQVLGAGGGHAGQVAIPQEQANGQASGGASQEGGGGGVMPAQLPREGGGSGVTATQLHQQCDGDDASLKQPARQSAVQSKDRRQHLGKKHFTESGPEADNSKTKKPKLNLDDEPPVRRPWTKEDDEKIRKLHDSYLAQWHR